MTRYARGFKKKHEEATSWEDMKKTDRGGGSISEGVKKDGNEKSKALLKREIKQEKNREARRKRRSMKKLCFHCRKPGHALTDCPAMKNTESAVDICFKCGSSEHTVHQCKTKVPKDSFPFAKCFVCGQEGHISRKCPDNPRGLYPLGGGCKFCDSVEHFKRDCPKNPANQKKGTGQSKGLSKRKINDLTSADAEAFSDEENEEKTIFPSKKKKPTVVKF